ncbi:MAG: 16S rRNA (guanine(966)-N(2))-methyltransferase RsmD [Gammaproteobacteria bacterium]|nr:16S rRNA (guanine(966)-N(2))-methyltransferase RsmD [Gammaproteobacteria bacterium]
MAPNSAKYSAKHSAKQAKSQIRIIAGLWRGSRLEVLDKKGLRPTPDRVRETLFNWLSIDVPGANVLDCFAGAGGLGMEAASREARKVTLVDKDRVITGKLSSLCDRLGAENTRVVNSDVLAFLRSSSECYNLVFIDPPYDLPELRSTVLDELVNRQLLCTGALIYLEWPIEQEMQLNHAGLTWIKQKKAGRVSYAIAQWNGTR